MLAIICNYIHIFAIAYKNFSCIYTYEPAIIYVAIQTITVNGERLAGLNFRVFHSFQEHRESFPLNNDLYYTSFV